MKKYFKLLLMATIMLLGSLFAFAEPFKADTISEWTLQEDDYYYYTKAIVSTGASVDVKVPSRFENYSELNIEYNHPVDGTWIPVPMFEVGGFNVRARTVRYTTQYNSIFNKQLTTFYYYTGDGFTNLRVADPSNDTHKTMTVGGNFRFKNPVDNVAPVITGETHYITNVDNPVTEATIKSGLSAYDNKDGYLGSSSFVKVSDTYTANKNKVGVWLLKYRVTDSSGNYSEITINVNVKDIVKPTITGQSSYTVVYNQTQNLTTVKNNLTVTDNYYTGLTAEVVTDNYTANKNKVGAWTITYQATDGSGNKSNLYTVTINVIDNVKPTISGTNSYTRPYNSKLELSTIKAALTANDAYDGDLTSSITLKSDNYSPKYNQKGTYQVVYTVKDSSNNSTDYTVTINVIDNIKPTITGTNAYSTGSTEKLLESTIRSGLTAIDDYDGALEVVLVEDNYSGSSNILGTHKIIYKATDSSGNVMEFEVTVTVEDDVPPVIHVTDHFIQIDGGLNMTIEDIIEHLIYTGQLDENFTAYYNVLENDYQADVSGEYLITMSRKETAPSHLKELVTLGVKVFEAEETPDPTTEDPNDTDDVDKDDKTFGDQFIDFFNDYGVYLVVGLVIFVVLLVIARQLGFGRRRRW